MLVCTVKEFQALVKSASLMPCALAKAICAARVSF